MTDLTPEWIDRLRRLVACDRWWWMGGCKYIWPGTNSWNRYCVSDMTRPDDNAIPDPRDPATLGCLLAMLWEAWPACSVKADKPRSCVWGNGRQWFQEGAGTKFGSEPWQAVVASLEVAWGIAA